MKYLLSQLLFILRNKTTRRNINLLLRFLLFLTLIISVYSVLFHLLMLYEGRDFSWITGLYWTLTVMSTLGFGDITFSTDIGLLFTILVLGSGIILLLIMLPFSFIQFFYAPWLEAQTMIRTPRELPANTAGHVIITSLDPITEKLIEKLNRRKISYALVSPDLRQASDLFDSGYKVVVGEVDDPMTYQRLRVDQAALVVATGDDLINTSISFTVREITADVPVVTTAAHVNSLDILEFAGNSHVFQFNRMLGQALAERTLGLGRPVHIVSRFDQLNIAEISAMQTSLGGRRLTDTGIRPHTGAMIVGLWEKGKFEVPGPETIIGPTSLLLLAGSIEQLDRFEQRYAKSNTSTIPEAPVLILGGGSVGLAAARTLKEYGIDFTIVEQDPSVVADVADYHIIIGDAADINTLEKAGVKQARTAIITTHTDAMNVYLTFYCRKLRPEIQLITRATHERTVPKLHMAGADLVLSYASMGANTIINLLKTDEISMFTEGFNVFSLPVPKNLSGKSLAQSNIREKSGCSVVALKTKKGLIVGPDPSLPLNGEDIIILIGTTEAEQKLISLFATESLI